MEDFGQQRILIVDDAQENIDILTGILTFYKKSIALNGEKALKIARQDNSPDLILLDIVMPGMDGFDVCKQLKSDVQTRDIPVIFLTGQTDSESVVQGLAMGAVDYVSKPFNASELLARVSTHLALKRSQDAIARYVKEIGQKNRMITDSINYASLIQNAVLQKEAELTELLNDYFVLYRPKDIVSGDFYWSRRIDGKIILVGADCTGHGVPGAFMSMIGVAFLNEIVGRENVTTPALIIDRLREMIIRSLGQDSESEVKDGMDMAVISIGSDRKTLEFAGANNPMYLVRDGHLTQVDADKMPVSIYDEMTDFKNISLEIKDNDRVYLFSDGYADQRGGPDNKKLKNKAFKNLILEHAHRPMKEQEKNLSQFYDQWKGNHEQIDDVMVIGIEI